MMEDELIKIWQSSPEVEQVKFEKSRLMLDLDHSLGRFYRWLKYAVLIEQLAAMITVPIFLYYIYWVPPSLSKIASLLIVLYIIWYMFRLKKIKGRKPESVALSYLEYLKSNRTYLKYLKDLADTMVYWYFLPLFVAVIIFISGYYLEGIIDKVKFIKIIFSLIVFNVALCFLARWNVKRIYGPRLQKIDELIEVMESQN